MTTLLSLLDMPARVPNIHPLGVDVVIVCLIVAGVIAWRVRA